MLPLPCTVPSPVGRRRNILVVLCLVSVVALYHYSAPISQANNTAVTWRPDLAGLINPGNIGSVWHHTQPKDASYYDLRAANPNNFRIKSPAASLLPQQHFTKNPPSSQGNPWPSKPEILERYFNPQRKIQDPPLPDWPTASNLRQADELLNRPAIHFVPFDELYMGKNKIPDMGKPKRNPKRVQSTDTAESEEERAERHRRRDWVEKAIRHAWEGYKCVKHACAPAEA